MDQDTDQVIATVSDATGDSSESSQTKVPSTVMSTEKSETQSSERPTAGHAQKEDTHMEDFASALESYTLETEPAPSEDNVFKGSVIKITATHVVVDIGFKSEGLVPIAEVTDADGNIKFQPGDEIA